MRLPVGMHALAGIEARGIDGNGGLGRARRSGGVALAERGVSRLALRDGLVWPQLIC